MGTRVATRAWQTCRTRTRCASSSASLSSNGELWTLLNTLAARPGAINMGQGFPDFEGSKVAREGAKAALDVASLNQYAPISGLLELREEVSKFYARRYGPGATYDAETEIVVTTSGQEALVSAIRACIARTGKPGVLVMEPFYPFLKPAIAAAGGAMRPVRLEAPDFALCVEALAAAVDETTGMAVLNSPHNPTGRVSGADELRAFAKVCVDRDLWAISDEVYEHSVFPGKEHLRLADLEGMRERTITLSSAGKLFSLTGWRVGWALAPPDVAADLAGAHAAFTYAAPTPLQYGVARALAVEDGTFDGVADLFHSNFEKLSRALAERGLDVCPADGGYFLIADAKMPDMDFVRHLADETGVVCTPLSVFYHTPPTNSTFVRFTICKSAAHIDRACEALRSPAATSAA